ncbi:hypothetical protein J5491_03315 [Candidatus Saccharibacteria bacterium]|nr:hypothetical protein [Candidatus Saccharibacteria bacterium]
MRRKLLALLTVFGGMIGVLLCTSNSFATIDNSVIMEKWFLTEYYSKCSDSVSSYINNDYVIAHDKKYVKDAIFDSTIGGRLTIPKTALPAYGFSGVESKKKIGCEKMFTGSDETSGLGLVNTSKLSKYADLKWSGSGKDINDFLTKIGYINKGGSQIIQLKYSAPANTIMPTSLSYNADKKEYSPNRKTGVTYFSFSVDNRNKKIKFYPTGPNVYEAPCPANEGWNQAVAVEIAIGNTVADTAKNIEEKLGGKSWCVSTTNGNVVKYGFPVNGFVEVNGGGGTWEYTKSKSTLDKSIKEISGFGKVNDVFWTNSERYTVYLHYLTKASTGIVCDPESVSDNYKKVRLKDNSGKINDNCYVNLNGREPSELPVAIQSPNKLEIIGDNTDKKSTVTLQTIIDWLKKAKYSDKELAEMATVGEATEGLEETEPDEAEVTCANAGGAASLGWILCPVIDILGNAAEYAYNDLVEPSLRVDPMLFSGGNEGVKTGWEQFRNIANTAFIILLLVVIFSQLTGVGIDNYGIKKIMPKLIIAAVLINLSYLICILLVDLSNILGNGLRMMFDGLSVDIQTKLVVEGATKPLTIDSTSSTLITVGLAGAAVAMVGAIWQNPAILLSVFVAVLGVAIAIFFLFILLSVREAAIVVLTVVSPLVVAAFMLPNTKKLFDKWWKLFQALLLVYPICGLLVGAGNYISRLLISSQFGAGGFLNVFTALIVGIVPIFFIPTVLKGSFSAMGKIGDKLTGLGSKARSSATSKIRGSEGYKNVQKRGLERRAKVKAGYSERKGRLNWKGNLKSKLASSGGVVGAVARGSGWAKSYAGYVDKAEKLREENINAKKTLMNAGRAFDIAQHPELNSKALAQKQILDAAGKGAADLEAAVAAVVASGTVKEKDIAGIIRDALNSGGFEKLKKDGSLRGVLEKMHTQYGNGFLATDYELGHFVQNGGTTNGGKLGKLGEYATATDASGKDVIDLSDLKPEQLTKLSGSSLAAMAASGKLTPKMAERVLALNPNISDDKKIMLGALADNQVKWDPTLSVDQQAEKFKKDAEELLKVHKTGIVSTGNSIRTGGSVASARAAVDKWTAPKPQDVNVV